MKGPMTIRFVPIGEGDLVTVPSAHDSHGYSKTVNHYLGFLPGKRGTRLGHLVYGVHEGAAERDELAPKFVRDGLIVRSLRVKRHRAPKEART